MDQPHWPGRKPQEVPDLGELARKLRQHLPKKGFLIFILLVVALLGANSLFYKVATDETGVLLRLGKYIGSAPPGLHFKLPFGIDSVYLVKTGRVLKEEFGFRTVSAGTRTSYSKDRFDDESLTLTGDLNVSDIEWIVQYQIRDPFKFLFHLEDQQETIRDISESVVRKVVGNSNVNQVLTTDRALLASQVQDEMQRILNQYDVGVRIVTVKFQDVNPPEAVKAAFNEVNEAEQQKESLILQAREQYNKEVPKARGVARSAILGAEGYAVERLNNAQGEAKRFIALLEEYKKAPEVTRRRLYLETMEQILPTLQEIYVMDDKAAGALPIFNLRGETKGDKP